MNYLEKYNYTVPSGLAISQNLAEVASIKVNNEILMKCFSLMDLTTLNPSDTRASVAGLVEKVNAFAKNYPQYPLPASICVFSNFADVVKEARASDEMTITVTSACFPTSQSFLEVKVLECEMAVAAGAEEVDIVLALNEFVAGNYEAAASEIRTIKAAIDAAAQKQGRKVVLKVILETGVLVDAEKIAIASFLAMEAGADFIKTSTGKVAVNATGEAVWVMCEAVARYYEVTGVKVGVKAAGGIVTPTEAAFYYNIINKALGEEWICKNLFRLGVSRLANNIVSEIEGKDVKVV